MFVVAHTAAQIVTKPLAFARRKDQARQFLNSPIVLKTIVVTNNDFMETPYICTTHAMAEQLKKSIDNYLTYSLSSLPRERMIAGVAPFPSDIVLFTNGIYRVTFKAFIEASRQHKGKFCPPGQSLFIGKR